MYARNNASPRPITIGAVVQISDGAVQTTGVSVKVRKDAGAWGAGAGTLAVEEGIWSYTPTQGETDCDALQIIIYKTSCIPNSMEVVFTSSSSFGHAGTDQSKIANPTSTVNLSGTTIKTATDVETKIDAIDDYIDTEVAAIKAKTDNLPSDPADASDIAASFATVNNNLSSIAGYIDTEVAAIKAKTDNLPANPAAVSDIPTANQNRDAVLNADPNAGYTDGSFGDRLLISDNNNRTVKVTGSNHVAADIHELQPGVIDSTHLAAGAIDANALDASASTEIATAVGTLQVLTDLVTMIINDGTATARWSAYSLGLAPTGGGGGTGTGARTVAITVTLSAAPVEGASVRLTKAAETYVGTTNASGLVTFNVDDGTWTVSITSPNATFAGASLVVDDNETVSYSLTAISITPSPAGQMTGYWTCYSHLGVVESGVSVTMQLVDVPKGSKGLALDSKTRTVTANGSGVAQFTNLFPGCRYKVYRGAADNKAFYVTLPEVAPADPVELGSFYGDDE